MTSLIWLAVSSFVWGGVLCLAGMLLQRNSNLSGRMRQWIWRGAMLLLIAPWVASPLVSLLGIGLGPAEPGMVGGEPDLQVTAALPAAEWSGADASWIVQESGGWAWDIRDSRWVDVAMLAVMLGWVLRFVLAQLSARTLMGIVANSEPAGAGPARRALEAWSARLGLKRLPRLRFAAGNVSPFSYGIFCPAIILPVGLEQRLDAKALDLVVGHECLHVARGDGWFRPLERVVADVMWFNPFAWTMRREADVARELAIDEGVVVISDARRAYARALRDVAGLAVGLPVSLPAASMSLAGSGKSLVLRMRRTLALAKRKPARAAIIATVMLGVAGACTSVAQAMLATPAAARVEAVAIETTPAPLSSTLETGDALLDQTPAAPASPQAPKPAFQPRLEGATQPVLRGDANVKSKFGYQPDPFNPDKTSFHEGIDLQQYWGAPVFAPIAGTVSYAGTRGTYGRVVEITVAGGDYKLRFGHLNAIMVKTDDKIEAGVKLGVMGSSGRSTGPHLHFEIFYKGKLYDPLTVQGLRLADKMVDAPQALQGWPVSPPETPDNPPPSPNATPIMFEQQTAPLPSQPKGGVQSAPFYAPMAMRVVSVEADASGKTVSLESLAPDGANRGCKLTMTAMTDVKARAGDTLKQNALVGTRNANSDRRVNCAVLFAQALADGATERALEASKIPAIPATPVTPATPAAPPAPSAPATPTSYTPQADAEYWKQFHGANIGVSRDAGLVRTRYQRNQRPEVRSPFGARVTEVKQASAATAIVTLQQTGPGRAAPLTASSQRCVMSLVLSSSHVAVGQVLAEGDVIGESPVDNVGRVWTCDGVAIADGPADIPPKLEGATHALVDSPARFTSGFGIRTDVFGKDSAALHSGMDIGKQAGAAIYAPAAATVWRAESDPDLGNVVVLGLADGYTLRFSRLDQVRVKQGDKVKAGDTVGTMGSTGPSSTGPHLHFEVFRDGRIYNPEVVPGLSLIGPQ